MPDPAAFKPWLEPLSYAAVVLTLFVYIYLGFAAKKQIDALNDQRIALAEQSRSAMHQQAWNDLFAKFDRINDYARDHNVQILNPYPRLRSGESAPLLFHHLNLIFRFHVYKAVLSREESEGFARWLEIVFFPWIEAHESLKDDLRTILTAGDLYPEGFLRWMREHPTYAKVMRPGSHAA